MDEVYEQGRKDHKKLNPFGSLQETTQGLLDNKDESGSNVQTVVTDAEIVYGDDSDTRLMMNKKLWKIDFFHVASNKSVAFKSFLRGFSNGFESKWNEEDVYGRMDSIPIFGSTKRKVSLSWATPSYSERDAQNNLAKVARLCQFLYPSYTSNSWQTFRIPTETLSNSNPKSVSKKIRNQRKKSSLTTDSKKNPQRNKKRELDTPLIQTPPLLKVKFANLLSNTTQDVRGTCAKSNGAYAYITSLGVDLLNDQLGMYDPASGALYPKLIVITCDLTIIHDHIVGWGPHGNPIFSPLFPFD